MVRNIHSRVIAADARTVGGLLDTLAAEDDRLWPLDRWPAMRLDRPLGVGASGGHGPIRYTCAKYLPGQEVRFRFHRPRGFGGEHGYLVQELDAGRTRLTHECLVRTRGAARFTWPLIWRWLHDALIEDSLDRAEAAATSGFGSRRRHGGYVRFLRAGVRTWSTRRGTPATDGNAILPLRE